MINAFLILSILAAASLLVASQLCDDDPLILKGVKIASQASASCLKGRTHGMTEIASCQDNSVHDIGLPFSFRFLERTYNGSGSVFVSSNSFVTFGRSSSASTFLSSRNPAFPTLFIGGRDNGMLSLSVGHDHLGWRVRYEGWSIPSLANITVCSPAFIPTIVWELTFSNDGMMQLCTGAMQNMDGISAVSDGISTSFVQKFSLASSSFYTIRTGMLPCACDNNPPVNKGLKIVSLHSASCLKGRTPDMIVRQNCSFGNSTSIRLPFSFKFLGQAYGGKDDDIFVGHSSYITFGGSSSTYASFEPDFSSLPSILIGAGDNVLSTLSVAPHSSGWLVRYEGWTNSSGKLPALSGNCASGFPPTNITWELLFLYDGTLQLCTSVLMDNLVVSRNSISAFSNGVSNTFMHNFALASSTLYTISTGLRPCVQSCDNDTLINNGVNILFDASTSCLKGRSTDMIDIGSCQDDAAFDIGLPFPFQFLSNVYSSGDVFVGSNSYVTFGARATSRTRPTLPSFLIGSRDNAMRLLSVGSDPLGWRVRFEGWDSFMSLNSTVDCTRPPNIIWELVFLRDSTFQLCSSSLMNNADDALIPLPVSGMWDGKSLLKSIELKPSTLYNISTSLPPCSLDLSLSCPIASVNGSVLTVRFPANISASPFVGSATLMITLQGAGFWCAPDTRIQLALSPVSSQASGTATIFNSSSAAPLLIVSLQGLNVSSLVSFTISPVITPHYPQPSRKNISFSIISQNTTISGESGTLVEITPPASIDKGQPVIELINNVMQSSTTVNITLTATFLLIPATSTPSAIVITLFGAGWSVSGSGLGQFINPRTGIVIRSVSITTQAANVCVMIVRFSGFTSMSQMSHVQFLVFNVTTPRLPQLSFFGICSAFLNSAGSVVALGSSGTLNAIMKSSMGHRSPSVAFIPPLASSSDVFFDVSLNPQPLYQRMIELPFRIIITLTGSGFACSTNAIVKFMTPFDAANGTATLRDVSSTSVLTVDVRSGTFISGYPLLFQFGPCTTPPRLQFSYSNISAAMIDKSGMMVAASSSGFLSAIVGEFSSDQTTVFLTDNIINVSFTPSLMLPSNSFLVISLTGTGLGSQNYVMMAFTKPSVGASGSAAIISHPDGTLLVASFSAVILPGTPIAFSVSSVHAGCANTSIQNLHAALFDEDGNIMAASASVSFTSTVTRSPVTVMHLIQSAVNGIINIPQGIYAGKCNCNNVIDQNLPQRPANSTVEIIGTEQKSIIDCSGTGMRCLIVRGSSIKITNVIFKGGSSPKFVSPSMLTSIQAVINAENPHLTVLKNQQPYFSSRHNESLTTSVEEGAGGCVYVLAPSSSVHLGAVSLIGCRAVFGGGGFFNVSTFVAVKGIARSNFARQGGGIFVAAPQRTDIEQFEFMNNTVATHLTSILGANEAFAYYLTFSDLQFMSILNPKMFSNISGANSAVGAGAWLQSLSCMRNCSFQDNLALAASTFNWTERASSRLGQQRDFPGAHAVGSGLFILRTSKGSSLSAVTFTRSVSICASENCVSYGSMVVAFADYNTSISDLLFVQCEVRATGNLWTTYAEAASACVAVLDASAGLLNIKNLKSFNCSFASAGRANGGCLFFPQYVNHSSISNIFVANFTAISNASNRECGSGKIMYFAVMTNTTVSNVTVRKFRDECNGSSSGLIFYATQLLNSTLASLSTTDVTVDHANGRLRGGMILIYFMDVASLLTNITLQNALFVIQPKPHTNQTASNIGYNGAAVYLGQRSVLECNVRMHGFFMYDVHAMCSGPACAAYALFFMTVDGLSGPKPGTFLLQNFIIQNVSTACNGVACLNLGVLSLSTELFNSPYRPLTNVPSFQFFDAVFQFVTSLCIGDKCSARSACLTTSVRDGEIRNIRVKNVTVDSIGSASFAGGPFLFHMHNNPLRSFVISNVTSQNTKASASGASSYAIGGVIVAMYGNVTISDSSFMDSNVFCEGTTCQSLGGFTAFTSSLGPSAKRTSALFHALYSNCAMRGSVVKCSGATCVASGGAIYAGVAFRGPLEILSLTIGQPSIAYKGIAAAKLSVGLTNCSIFRNKVVSDSLNATVSGAGITLLFASAVVVNSSVAENSIVSSFRSAFVGGAGIYVSGERTSVSISSSEFVSNNASDRGFGGAIFVGQAAECICQTLLIKANHAENGGGLYVDVASMSISTSKVFANSASDKGGGISCVASSMPLLQQSDTTTTIILSDVSVYDNLVRNNNPASVGAAAYIFGNVRLEIRDGTRFSMNGNPKFTTVETVVSVGREANIANDTVALCQNGSVLSIAGTNVENQEVSLIGPDYGIQITTQCAPSCPFVPKATPYTASSGFLASCVPCPRGTYSLSHSSRANDSVGSQCEPCPFGAVCHGGSLLSASKSYWGWKTSEHILTKKFMLLPSGYGCGTNCDSISPCGGNREGVLCGACTTNYSVAFFTTECVPSEQCASWKWALLIFLCIFYQFCFSLWMFWSSETEILLQISEQRTWNQQVLKSVSLFDNLSSDQIDILASKMELVNVSAHTSVITHGQISSALYFLKKGFLNVYIRDDTGKEILGSRLVPPDVFGEASCINGAKSTATVSSVIDCELWKLDHSCLNIVSDVDKLSYIQSKQLSYSNQPVKSKAFNIANDETVNDAFGVLMWFYQIAGIMLSVTSPVSYLRGTAIFYSIVSFFSNSKPASQAASDAAATASSSFSDENDAKSNDFQFCVDPSFTMSQLYVTSFMYYVCWAFLMAIFARKRFWRFLRRVICAISLRLAQLLDFLSGYINKCGGEESNSTSLQETYAFRQTVDFEIRGSVILKWSITCFNAVAILMMQGTTCFQLNGFPDAAGSRRWMYDGRVVCFSNDGEFPGRWQIASAFGVSILFIAPAVLWRIMVHIQRMDKNLRTPFQKTLLDAYSGTHSSNACHWKVIM
jgi:hypothetical protein